jgi:hypothetical protein
MSPEKMIPIYFAAAAAKLYEVFLLKLLLQKTRARTLQNCRVRALFLPAAANE